MENNFLKVNTMPDLDAIDLELLKLLKHDSRASVTELANTLGVSRVTLKSRLTALRANGTILRFTIDVAHAHEEDQIQAVSMLELQLTKANKVHRELMRIPEITNLYSTNGKWSVVAHSETKNLKAFDNFLSRIGNLNGVTNVETCLLLTRLM